MIEQQKQLIIKTAGEMFFRLGIRSVSIDDICNELGMSKKTFYVYFESKDELVAQMLHANVEYIAQKMEDLMVLHDFRQLVAKFLKHQEAEKNDVRRVPQLVYDLKKYYPLQFAQFQKESFETQRKYIAAYLEQGQNEGLGRPIYINVGDRLESRHRRDIDDLRARLHVRQADLAERQHGTAV